MIEILSQWIFWCVAFLIVYHHVGYPLILKVLARQVKSEKSFVAKHTPFSDKTSDNSPSIAIIIPAYNEEKYIYEKLINLSFLDYPKEKLSIWIGCDGCSDLTVFEAERAKLYCQENTTIEVINFTENRGKIATINDLVSRVDADILVFSDVSALVSIDALRVVEQAFSCSGVGAATGHYKLLEPGSEGESAYWNYQVAIKRAESKIGSTIGVHGAFYAMRRQLFQPLSRDVINDDFVIPMRVVEAGYQVQYLDDINAVELEGSTAEMDWQRRLRIGAGNMQQTLMLWRVLNPKLKGTFFNYVSGKFLRVTMPFCILFCFLLTLFLATHSVFFALVLLAQSLGLVIAYLSYKYDVFPKVGRPIAYILAGHLANFLGAIQFLSHRGGTRW